jgi:hypothetical protein
VVLLSPPTVEPPVPSGGVYVRGEELDTDNVAIAVVLVPRYILTSKADVSGVER